MQGLLAFNGHSRIRTCDLFGRGPPRSDQLGHASGHDLHHEPDARSHTAQSFHGLRAAVEALAGHPDSVIAALERLVGPPACKLTLSWSDVWGPTSQAHGHERLGQLYDARGDVPHAIDHYRRFVELWPDPDPELRPRWNAAKRRLAELSEAAPVGSGGGNR